MKGENFFSELPTIWRFIFLGGAVLIAVAWYLYCKRSERLSKKAEVPASGDLALKEKKVVTIYDYIEDSFDKHRFISAVDSRLTIREVTHKNHDRITLATSWPHLFTHEQLIEIQKMFLEITKLSFDRHEITITKSPAASIFNFRSKLLGEIFAQLHRQYALRFFRQHFQIKKDGDRAIDLIFDSSVDYIDDLSNLLDRCRSIFLSIINDNIPEYRMVVIKNDGSSWQELKNDVLAVAADFFPAGVDFEGEWPEDEIIKPQETRPTEIKVPFYFNKFGNLVLEFPGLELSSHIKILLAASDEIETSHIAYVFEPKKGVVEITLKPEASLAILEQDVRCALALYDSQTDFVLDGEWPKAGIAIDSNTLGQGSINT